MKSAFGVEHVSKKQTAPPSNEELRRKKEVQARYSIVGSTLGIAGLGALGAGKLVPVAAKKFGKDAVKARRVGHKLTNASLAATTTAAGVGGISGYHFAALQRAEARKKRI